MISKFSCIICAFSYIQILNSYSVNIRGFYDPKQTPYEYKYKGQNCKATFVAHCTEHILSFWRS